MSEIRQNGKLLPRILENIYSQWDLNHSTEETSSRNKADSAVGGGMRGFIELIEKCKSIRIQFFLEFPLIDMCI